MKHSIVSAAIIHNCFGLNFRETRKSKNNKIFHNMGIRDGNIFRVFKKKKYMPLVEL